MDSARPTPPGAEDGTGLEPRPPGSDQQPETISRQSQTPESTRTFSVSARATKERPCDACRRRKTRCVKESGELKCVLCKFHSQACTYLHEPIARNRKRKLQPNESSGDSSRKSRNSRSSVLSTNVGTGIEEYDEYSGESLLKQTLGLQNKHHARFVGLTEPFSFPRFSLPLGTSQKTTQGGVVTVRKVDNFHAFTIREDQGTVGYETERSRLDAIEQLVSPHGRELVDLYFRIVHPSFPILHKGVFLEKYARSYREFSPSLLAAVYLLATNYWPHSSILTDKPKPDADALWHLAIESFDLTIYRPKLSSVQAGLLLAQYESTDTNVMSSGSRGRLTAHLIAMCHTLGLHMNASGWDLPGWEISLRCRLAWALWMQDKWVALIEGRPSLLSDRDWIVPMVQPEDFPESQEHDEEGSSEVEKGRIIFIQMIELTRMLSDALDSVFGLRSTHDIQNSPDPLSTLMSRIRPIQARLKNWSNMAMELLSLEKKTTMKLTSIGYLRLAHLAVEVSIHRRIMCLVMSSITDPTTAAACRTAARQRWLCALEFVDGLKARHLKSFWYFSSTACLTLLISFGNVLVGSSSDPAEEEFFLSKLKEFRWTLKINGEMGASFMTAAINSMILDPNEIRNPQSPSLESPATSTMATTASSYDIPPLQTFDSRIMVPAQGTLGPPPIAPGWSTPSTYTNAPTAFPNHISDMSMQIPYPPRYVWQPSIFDAGPSMDHMPG